MFKKFHKWWRKWQGKTPSKCFKYNSAMVSIFFVWCKIFLLCWKQFVAIRCFLLFVRLTLLNIYVLCKTTCFQYIIYAETLLLYIKVTLLLQSLPNWNLNFSTIHSTKTSWKFFLSELLFVWDLLVRQSLGFTAVTNSKENLLKKI
mgnify:CR=1 FL=1